MSFGLWQERLQDVAVSDDEDDDYDLDQRVDAVLIQSLLSGVPVHQPRCSYFYALALLLNFSEFVVLALLIRDENSRGFAWNFKFLTYINGLLQITYWTLCLLDNWNYGRQRTRYKFELHDRRDDLFTAIVFPIGTFVGIGFYTLIREFGDTPLSYYRQNFAHGGTTLLVVIELLLVHHRYWKRGKRLLQSLIPVILSVMYLAWNFVVHGVSHKWVYPFQGKLTVWMEVVLYPVLVLLVWSLFFVGLFVNNFFHIKKVPKTYSDGASPVVGEHKGSLLRW